MIILSWANTCYHLLELETRGTVFADNDAGSNEIYCGLTDPGAWLAQVVVLTLERVEDSSIKVTCETKDNTDPLGDGTDVRDVFECDSAFPPGVTSVVADGNGLKVTYQYFLKYPHSIYPDRSYQISCPTIIYCDPKFAIIMPEANGFVRFKFSFRIIFNGFNKEFAFIFLQKHHTWICHSNHRLR